MNLTANILRKCQLTPSVKRKAELSVNILRKTRITVSIEVETITPINVTIGTQTWKIKNVDDNIVKSYVYNDEESNRDIYGGLYTWSQIAEIEALYPGWHVPTDAEFATLIAYLGGSTQAGKIKETGTDHWDSPNTGATNSSGFTALGCGQRTDAGAYQSLKQTLLMWTANEDGDSAWTRGCVYTTGNFASSLIDKDYALPIRLIKD